MGMRRTVLAAVLVDREGALDAAGRPAEGLLHGRRAGRAPPGARRSGQSARPRVVDREDEAEVNRVPKAAAVIHQGPTDRLLVAAEDAVSLTDAV
jgi:hypothetical protein